MEILKPHWSSSTFLAYAGGATVLGAAASALAYLASQYGSGAYAAWALLVFAVLFAIAAALRPAHRVTAGVFAFVAVIALVALLAALWKWFGWNAGAGRSPFDGFHVARLALELIVIVAAVAAVRAFRAPLLVSIVAATSYLFIADLVSNGGNWSAWVTVVLGLVLLLVGVTLDAGARRPYGFWVHVVAGATFGGALLFFWHSGNWRWGLAAVASVVFVRIAIATRRSSWAVFGALGLLAAATHYTVEWWHRGLPFIGGTPGAQRGWVPALVFAITGFLLVLLGFVANRRETGRG
jgi:hypothetical protein